LFFDGHLSAQTEYATVLLFSSSLICPRPFYPFADPMYISPHSAEAILSDFRPLKLQTDALTFLNLFLDDILANIISSARSILTDRLKTGLLKTVPTTIGKDALLEAEMELRAYWQRPNAIKPSASQASASEHNFSLPSMIEVSGLF
jgi:hypothetical protein